MSVLPQLEEELAAAHARRARRRRLYAPRARFGGLGLALGAAVALAVAVLSVVIVRSARESGAGSSGSVVLWRGPLYNPYAAGGSLYGVPPTHPPDPAIEGASDLIRIDPSSGQVVARVQIAPPPTTLPGGGSIQLDPAPEYELLAAGSLWVTATAPPETLLFRFDPRSLEVRSMTRLPGAGAGGTGSMAVAGGWLWVANGNTLDRVSLKTGRNAGSRPFSTADAGLGNSIASDAGGRVLLATTGTSGAHWRAGMRVLRLDPGTGVPIASARFPGGNDPAIAGIIDGGGWVNEVTNFGGPVRLDLRTLKVTARFGRVGDFAHVFNGILWKGDQTAENSCLDPLTGRLRARLPTVIAADGSNMYVFAWPHGKQVVMRMALPAGCR